MAAGRQRKVGVHDSHACFTQNHVIFPKSENIVFFQKKMFVKKSARFDVPIQKVIEF